MTHKPEWESRYRATFYPNGDSFGVAERQVAFLSQEIQRAKEEERERMVEMVEEIVRECYFKDEGEDVREIARSYGISPDSKTSEDTLPTNNTPEV